MRSSFTSERGRARQARAAHSIVEVLVAVLALAIMVVTLYVGFSSGFAVVHLTRENLRATQIMMQKMEAVRLCTWSQLTNVSFVDCYNPLATSNDAGGAAYSGTVSVGIPASIPDAAAYKTNLRLVTITVYWTNFSVGKPVVRSRQMETHVARYGLQNYRYGTP